jgi:hypothetical protein
MGKSLWNVKNIIQRRHNYIVIKDILYRMDNIKRKYHMKNDGQGTMYKAYF